MNLFDTKEAALMLKSVKAIICLSVVALFIVTVGLFAGGCDGAADGDEPGTYRVILDCLSYTSDEKYSDFVGVCKTLPALKNICSRNNYGFFDMWSDDYDTAVGRMLRRYTIDYFKSNSLVLCAFGRSYYTKHPAVETVEVDSGKLTVNIKIPESDTADMVMMNYFTVIETDKSFVSDVIGAEYVLT